MPGRARPPCHSVARAPWPHTPGVSRDHSHSPGGPEKGTLPLQRGQTLGICRGSGHQPCHLLAPPGLPAEDSRAQAQKVSLRSTSSPGVPPAAHLHSGGWGPVAQPFHSENHDNNKSSSSKYSHHTCYTPGTVPHISHKLTHLLLTTTLSVPFYG